MSVTSEAVESLAETTEDLEIELEGGDSSQEDEEEEQQDAKGLECIAEVSENAEDGEGGHLVEEAGDKDGQEEDGSVGDSGEGSEDDGEEEGEDQKTEVEAAPVKEEPVELVEFPDTDVKIQYDRCGIGTLLLR